MRISAIVPQKALTAAKSRLGSVLSARARAQLGLGLLEHVCAALRAVPRVERLVVMTPDPAVCARAALWGIRAVLDPAPDFNAALAQMMTEAGTTHGILVLAADLPYVQPADIVALIGRASPGVVALAPSKDGTGTNGFVVPPRIRFQPAFGSGSRSAHRREAHARGLEVVEVARPGLACDLDTPADLNALWGRGGEGPA